MNLQQAKTTLGEISRSTATGHPKVLISQLCAVIAALIENLESPPLVELKKSKVRLHEDPTKQPSPYDLGSKPKDVPQYRNPKKRTGNAGDAK